MDVATKINRNSLVRIGISGSATCAKPTKEELFRVLDANLRLVKSADSKDPSPQEPAATLTYVGLDTGVDPNIVGVFLLTMHSCDKLLGSRWHSDIDLPSLLIYSKPGVLTILSSEVLLSVYGSTTSNLEASSSSL